MAQYLEKIQKLENLLQEPNILVTRNRPLDPTAFAIYKGNKEIFTMKLVFHGTGLDGLENLKMGIGIESNNLSGIFYPESPEYNEIRELYNSVGDMWLTPRSQKPKQSNLFKLKLFSNIFSRRR